MFVCFFQSFNLNHVITKGDHSINISDIAKLKVQFELSQDNIQACYLKKPSSHIWSDLISEFWLD
jgi:hypothetical protein